MRPAIGIWLVAAGTAFAGSDVDICSKIRRGHPRMFFTAESWPAIKTRSENDKAVRAAREKLIARAKSYPENPVCAHTERVSTPKSQPIVNVRDWGREASECALAWRFTGEKAYLEKAKRMLRVSAAAYHEAIANGRAVHWYSTNRILALAAYDWIFEALSDEDRRSIVTSLVKHVEEVQPASGKPWIIRRNVGGVESGFYSVRSLLWYSGLAAFGDGYCDDLAKSHLERGYELERQMVTFRADLSGDDGALAHGTPGYTMGAYPWAHFNFFHTYWSAVGENPAAEFKALAYFPNWIWWNRIEREGQPTRPHCFGYGDGQHQSNLLPVGSLFEHMSQYMHFYRDVDPDAARLAATLRALAPNRTLDGTWPMYPFILAAGADVKPFTDGEIAARRIGARHFPDVGQFFLRSGRSPDSAYCLYTAGSRTTMHKHMDEGNFVIYKGGFLALDSGSRGFETDTNLRYYYAQTVAHNCVLVHRPGEKMPDHWGLASDEPAAKFNDGGQRLGAAKVLAFETNPDFTYIASDLTETYGKKCTACVRQFVHLQPDVFVVYDRVVAADPAYRKEWLLHTHAEPSVDGRVVRTDSGEGRLVCETLLPTAPEIVKVGGPGKEFWSNGKNWELHPKFLDSAAKTAQKDGMGPFWGNWRFSVSPSTESAEDRFLHVLTVGKAVSLSAPVRAKLLVRDEREGTVIDLPDGRQVALVFNRSGEVGGRIKLGTNEARPLAVAVQPQGGVCGLCTVI